MMDGSGSDGRARKPPPPVPVARPPNAAAAAPAPTTPISSPGAARPPALPVTNAGPVALAPSPDGAIAGATAAAAPPPTPAGPPVAAPGEVRLRAAGEPAKPDDATEGSEGTEGNETTNPVPVPDEASAVEELIELAANEAGALLIGGEGIEGGDVQLADLNVRLALMAWDVLDDADASARYLELAEKHPLAARLMLSQAIDEGDAVQLEAAAAAAPAADPARGERAPIGRDVAEAWLYRFGDPRRAVAAARATLADRPADTLVGELRHVLCVGLAAAGEWGELATQLTDAGDEAARSRPGGKGPEPVLLAEAAHLLGDRLRDPAGAAQLLARIPDRSRDLHQVNLGLEACTAEAGRAAGLDEVALLRRRGELLEADGDARIDAAATRFLLAEALAARGDGAGAVALLTALSAPAAGVDPGWGPRLAALARYRLAAARGDWADAAVVLRDLAAGPGTGRLGIAYLRRAAELQDARVADSTRAIESWTRLAADEPGDGQAVRTAERLLLGGDPLPIIDFLEAAAKLPGAARPFLLRRAAAVAESRLHDAVMALRLRTIGLTGERDIAGVEDLARLYRKSGDRPRLAQSYKALAGLAPDKRVSSALLCAAGALELSRSRFREAEDAFQSASRHAPRDPIARAALAMLFRKAARWRELTQVLADLGAMLTYPASRLAALRELGRVTAQKLGDPRKARAHLEAALALAPDDGDTLHGLAELYGETGEWAKAVELRQRAVEVLTEPARRVVLLLEIGDIEERHRQDEAAALRAYQAALEADGGSLEALRGLAGLHRKRKQVRELLDVLRRELELTREPARRLAILLEIARHAEAEGDRQPALDAYVAAVGIEPANAPALAGVERLARRDARWDVLIATFRAAPPTLKNLHVLGEGLERVEAWRDLVAVRLAELDATPADADKAKLALATAQVCEDKLADGEGAVRLYERAAALDPAQHAAQRALGRLLEAQGRWAELAAALERELATVPPGDGARQIALLCRLGEVRRDRLDRAAEAALAFEAALEVDSKHGAALTALEDLYGRLGREKDLLRILEAQAAGAADSGAQAELWGRVAELRDRRGDGDGAIAAYREAIKADPTNRNTFTAMEKLCYKRERWPDAMELYTTAIEVVESGRSRAYRLGDLYSRRGQVQMQYMAQPGDAAASYLRVLELDPESETAVKFLETIYSQLSEWPSLIRAYEKRADLLRDDDRRLDTLRRAARVASGKLKDAYEAARLYDRIVALDGSDHEALDALERFHERNKDWDKLVEVLKTRLATAAAGDAAIALLRRIAQICEEGLHEEGRAIESYLRILEIAPGNKESLEALGRIYESTERWTDFIDVTRRQIRVTTDRNVKALLYFKCGSVMEAKFDKEEEAIRYYDAAIKTSPSCLPAVHGLRDVYRRREDWPHVIQTLELEVKLWQDDKERAGVFAQIGQIYGERLGAPDRAMHYYESALAVDPECVPANRALFEQYVAAGEWGRASPLAQALAQKAMREGDPTQRSDFYRKRGIVSRMTGDARGAAESLIIALEIKPANQDALDALGELAKAEPEAYDFTATYRELEKLYRKRDDAQALLARVLVAQANMKERDGDLDGAEQLYSEALALGPTDFTILSALIDLQTNMRRWPQAADSLNRFLERKPPPPAEMRAAALLRLAEVHGDGEMDPNRAASALREVIRHDPANQEAHYRLAQEMYLLGRYSEARAAIEKVIELAAAPGSQLSPEALARYYYYLGRIIEASGDHRAAASQYRRAAEYDPGYAPPALALAKRAADSGDQRAAETLLIGAAHAAMAQGGAVAAVPLQRGLARILLAAGDRAAAIEAYRGILAVEPDNPSDRVALAEIYAIDDLARAIQEVKRVLDRELRHGPAYRLLASFYARAGEVDRSARVLSIMELLGYAEDADRGAGAKARALQSHAPLRGQIDDEARLRWLVPPAAASPLGEVYALVAAELAQVFPQPPLGANLTPLASVEDPPLRAALGDLGRLFGVEPEIYVGDSVPGSLVVLAHPRRILVLDRGILAEPDPARRFVLGRGFDAMRAGYAQLLTLTRRERIELGTLLRSLLVPETERAAAAVEFVQSLPKRVAKGLERFVGAKLEIDSEAWIDAVLQGGNRAGLVACDDFGAAARMIARLNGDAQGVTQEGALALGAFAGGADLVGFFLSDEYHLLRETLLNPSMPGVG